MIRARLAIAFAFAALTGMAVGCGGGDNDSSDKAEGLTPNTFIAKADSICTQTQERVKRKYAEFLKEKKGQEAGGKGESPREAKTQALEAIETIGIPQVRLQLEALRSLDAPASARAKMKGYLDALEEEIETGEEDAQALNGPASKVFAKSEAAAKTLGFKVCANKNA